MKFKIIRFILVMVCLLSFVLPVVLAATLDITKDQWWEDIKFFHDNFKAMDLSLEMLPTGEFDKEVASLLQDVDKLDGTSINLRLMQIIARIGDAHTNMEVAASRILPVGFAWFEDGLFVTRAARPYERYIGSRVEKINNIPIDQVLEGVATLIPHENKQWVLRQSPALLRNAGVLKFLKITPNLTGAEFSFVSREGKGEVVDIPSFHSKEKLDWINYDTFFQVQLPLSQRPELTSKNYAYQYLPDCGTVYLQYNKCAEAQDKSFTIFWRELFDRINKENAKNIIIDLRLNTGGDWIFFTQGFLPKLLASKVKKNDNVYVLIGRTTFSAGTWALYDLTRKGYTNVYGEPTGGKPWHYGQVKNFELPNSKLRIVYTLERIHNGDPNADAWYPAYPVKVYSKDYFAGKDPVMEAVLTKIKENSGL